MAAFDEGMHDRAEKARKDDKAANPTPKDELRSTKKAVQAQDAHDKKRGETGDRGGGREDRGRGRKK